MNDVRSLVSGKEYDFLRTDKRLIGNIGLLCLGGSLSYGTDTLESDIDVRGFALPTERDLFGITPPYEQIENKYTDTVIYSLKKYVKLLSQSNPSALETLGVLPEHIIKSSQSFQIIKRNKHLFLSKRVIDTFGGFAHAQLRKLQSLSKEHYIHREEELDLVKCVRDAQNKFKSHNPEVPSDSFKLYLDSDTKDKHKQNIYMDVNLTHYPIRDYKGMISEIGTIINNYDRVSSNRDRTWTRNKICKYMMHIVRLYLMLFDILEKQEIITYRSDDHDMLMSIRNGYYLDSDDRVQSSFFDLVELMENKLETYRLTTDLPDSVDTEKIDSLVQQIITRNLILKGYHCD